MSRIPKMYVETSVLNFVFTDDAPERRKDTLTLLEEIHQGKYAPYTSNYVLDELEAAPEPKRSKMLDVVTEYGMIVIYPTEETTRLADMYVQEGILPRKYFADALHIAMAAVHDLDFIVSFNFKHIVKRKTITMTEIVNLREGYRRVGIFSPTEVIEYVD